MMCFDDYMECFNDYKIKRINMALSKYRNSREAAKELGCSPARISKIRKGDIQNRRLLTQLIGEDIHTIEIADIRQKKIEIKKIENEIKNLEEKLKELKKEF